MGKWLSGSIVGPDSTPPEQLIHEESLTLRLTYLLIVGSLCTPAISYGQNSWGLSGSVGYARSIQLSQLDGGVDFSFGVTRQLSPKRFVEVGFTSFNLGDDFSEAFIPGNGTPEFPDMFVTTHEEQKGWSLTGHLRLGLDTDSRWQLLLGGGFYNLDVTRLTVGRDSAGNVIRPPEGVDGDSKGAGTVVGLRFQPMHLGAARFGVELSSHLIALFSNGNGEDPGTLLHFMSAKAGVAVQF